jgi:sigma-B regulation protein RsbU (phosphoserine phosphatase)
LGLDHTVNFVNSLEEVEIKIKENDILVLFTDGITESKNSKLEDFGVERFERIIVKNGNLSLDGLAGEIMKEVTTFSQGSPQHDDITLVIFKWKFKNNNAGEV